MTAFEISLNGTKLCTAGINEPGILSAIITCGKQKDEPDDLCHFEVAGFFPPSQEHTRWHPRQLQPGDEICIKMVKQDSVDEPSQRIQSNPARDLEIKKEYVKRAAEELGWRIEMNPPASAK